ncbi:MAG: hypothetical protein JXB62_11985 [Pirellulales bacterium]|nr:hypothetical protein [Pirellulales bacterium]
MNGMLRTARRPIAWALVFSHAAVVFCAATTLLWAVAAVCAEGADSTGNTDGLLTWQVGTLEAGKSSRQVVLFAFDQTHDEVMERLQAAREHFAVLPEPPRSDQDLPVPPIAWIRNDTTDFALAGPGHFFWEGQRQTLTGSKGGQCSRFGYYLHYRDEQGAAHRAGTHIDAARLENLRVVRPMCPVDESQAVGVVETTDGQLGVRIRAVMGEGTTAAVELLLTNTSAGPLTDVRLSAYANLEAAHSHPDDYSTLDRKSEALLTVDPPSGMCLVMAGLQRPASGYSGTWASQGQLETASGVAFQQWESFAAIPDHARKALASLPRPGIPHAPAGPSEPAEPETRDLTPEEAAAVLRSDWLLQADGRPTPQRALQEIQWTRELAARLQRDPKTPDLSADLAELDRLEQRLSEARPDGSTATTEDARSLEAEEAYLAVRKVKRRITLKNPVVDFTRILLIDNPYPQGAEWPHQARHRNGMMAVPGGRLLVLEGLGPGGHVRKLAPEKPGSFWRPDLSFDAERVLFCYKAHDEKAFHLYEIDIDGSGLRQLTFGDYDDTDPLYLPDGHILFTTTRANTYVRCMPYTYAYVLARCDADGQNIYLVSRNNEPDWCPSLLNDGRVVYSRWEYHDKALWRIQSLWAMNPDGTGVVTFWGNQSVWPDHLAEPRAIPGSGRVMFTGLAHHDWFAGSIGIVDPDEGFNFPHGLTKVTCDVPWPECGTPPLDRHEADDYHVSGRFAAYKTPYPLSEEDFLVSARTDGRLDKFQLYLMDVHGNRELLYQGHDNVIHAMPIVRRTPPRRRPDRVAWPGTGDDRQTPQPGVLYSADVYHGVPDLPRGSVKHLRVIQMDARTYSTWTRDGRFSGPVVSGVQDDGVKRVLGTVPVLADGSVSMKVPAGRALHFQLLDQEYRAVHTMRSFTGVMPGEQRGCVGCHELHSAAPAGGSGLALKGPPREPIPPPWGTASLSYLRHVQPLLDRHCGKCHQGDGDARQAYDLTLRPGQGVFREPYLTLIGYAQYGGAADQNSPGIAGALKAENFDQRDPQSYGTFRPMRYLSYTSPLIRQYATPKHYGVELAPDDLRQLIAWVDANCPYRGDEDVRSLADPNFAGIDQLPIRPRTRTAPVIPRP